MKKQFLILFLLAPITLYAQVLFPNRVTQAVDNSLHEMTNVQRFEFVGGYGEKTDNFRLVMHWHMFSKTWRKYEVDFSLAANYSMFDGEENAEGDTVDMRDIGLTPTITVYHQKAWHGFRPYVEAGIGFHYLTDKHFSTKDFSTNFQFGDHIGLGVQFGRQNNLRLAYQFQHLSNAGIGNPNPGINFHLVNFGVRFK